MKGFSQEYWSIQKKYQISGVEKLTSWNFDILINTSLSYEFYGWVILDISS